jgi:nitroreductase/NAD-dependent dihydropyrimidine dehydrogenase PreA subunit
MIQNFFDLSKCNLCGICSEICPVQIIKKQEGTACPFVPENRAASCTKCGHCEAICPQNAIQVNHEKLQHASELAVTEKMTPDRIKAYFLNRRSIRVYKEAPVDKSVIEEILDIVRYAPSGVNRQPVKWIVVSDRKTVNQLSNAVINWMRDAVERKSPLAGPLNFDGLIKSWDKGNDPICRSAPHLIIAYGPKEDRMAPGDATIALSHLELIAPAFGLGACWAGYFAIASSNSQELKNLIELPQDHAVFGALMVGVPKYTYARVPGRNAAKVIWK